MPTHAPPTSVLPSAPDVPVVSLSTVGGYVGDRRISTDDVVFTKRGVVLQFGMLSVPLAVDYHQLRCLELVGDQLTLVTSRHRGVSVQNLYHWAQDNGFFPSLRQRITIALELHPIDTAAFRGVYQRIRGLHRAARLAVLGFHRARRAAGERAVAAAGLCSLDAHQRAATAPNFPVFAGLDQPLVFVMQDGRWETARADGAVCDSDEAPETPLTPDSAALDTPGLNAPTLWWDATPGDDCPLPPRDADETASVDDETASGGDEASSDVSTSESEKLDSSVSSVAGLSGGATPLNDGVSPQLWVPPIAVECFEETEPVETTAVRIGSGAAVPCAVPVSFSACGLSVGGPSPLTLSSHVLHKVTLMERGTMTFTTNVVALDTSATGDAIVVEFSFSDEAAATFTARSKAPAEVFLLRSGTSTPCSKTRSRCGTPQPALRSPGSPRVGLARKTDAEANTLSAAGSTVGPGRMSPSDDSLAAGLRGNAPSTASSPAYHRQRWDAPVKVMTCDGLVPVVSLSPTTPGTPKRASVSPSKRAHFRDARGDGAGIRRVSPAARDLSPPLSRGTAAVCGALTAATPHRPSPPSASVESASPDGPPGRASVSTQCGTGGSPASLRSSPAAADSEAPSPPR